MPLRGPKKFALLTTVLLAPVLVMVLLFVVIFTSYGSGGTLAAPPVGAGAGDTGGANALGEFAAGRDANRVQGEQDQLNRGLAIRPETHPAGFRVVVLGWQGDRAPSIVLDLADGERRRDLLFDGRVWSVSFAIGDVPPRSRFRLVTGDDPLTWGEELGNAGFRPLPVVPSPDGEDQPVEVALDRVRIPDASRR